jgi:sulfopyruvate decarboxylase subunit beta
VVECAAEDTAAAVGAALGAEQTTVIVSKCESGNIKVPVIELDPVMIKERFMASVAD